MAERKIVDDWWSRSRRYHMIHVVANEKAEKEFTIPVSWEVFSTIL